jgi:hypothetical protein
MTNLAVALMGLAFSSTLYAILLSTPFGRRWTASKTWTTVVLGTLLVLAWLAVANLSAALWALLFFGVGGVPIIIRELVLEFQREERIRNQAMKD